MIIKCHRKLTVNLRLFLEKLEYECYYNKSFENYDEIIVMTEDKDELVRRVEDYAQQWGFIPYHFALKLKKKGKKNKEDRVAVKVKMAEIMEFQALQGNFQLILFDSKGTNYMWKTYTSQTLPDTEMEMTAKIKAIISGMNGEVINLVSHCRLKEIKNAS